MCSTRVRAEAGTCESSGELRKELSRHRKIEGDRADDAALASPHRRGSPDQL